MQLDFRTAARSRLMPREQAEPSLCLLSRFNEPRHVTLAFGALADQQQVVRLDYATEILDRDGMLAAAAPDVGQERLSRVGRDALPQLGCRWCEFRKGLYDHANGKLGRWQLRLTPRILTQLATPRLAYRNGHLSDWHVWRCPPPVPGSVCRGMLRSESQFRSLVPGAQSQRRKAAKASNSQLRMASSKV